MGRVFRPRKDATEYTPVADDTLEKIVADECEEAEPAVTVEEVALFNWGTKEPREILRALVEQIGVKKADETNPEKSELDPTRGNGGKILLPKVVKHDGLSYEKTHTLKVKQQLPATAVSITSLDQWFLPETETCEVAYQLEGIKPRALKVDLEVFASNYCKTTATNANDFVTYTYTDIPDTPIITKHLRKHAKERSAATVSDWKGESEATEGVLKPRGKKTRYINAASSPYSVTVRYFKDDGHKDALLRVQSFWPRWSGTGGTRAIVDESLKIKWTIKKCPDDMEGQFQVFDKDGEIVWRQGLEPDKCKNGDQEFDWTEGKNVVTEDKMPYRVQIQIHTNKDKAPGLGLASMHTEVRLFLHKDVGTNGDDHEQDPQVLEFHLASFLPGKSPAEDSPKGRKLRLANAGYHPGPVADGETQQQYLMAVKEFQRDHQKTGSKDRLVNDGTIDADTKTAIAAQKKGRRALFGDTARADVTDKDVIKTTLNDKDGDLVVWVDDRHAYTISKAPAANNGFYTNMDMNNYRGGMEVGDGKTTTDGTTICRPFIPLAAVLPIMRKADTLDGTTVPTITDESRRATGPIRVDWTFRDLEPEYNVDNGEYEHDRARPLAFLTAILNSAPPDGYKGTHNGKDAFNCPDTLGGIRGADYYQSPFGLDDNSLMPCKAAADSGESVVCSVAHDDLGQDSDRVYKSVQGKATMYFNPSIVGGDGYQLRAQVSFEDLPSGATHPNWKTLKDRYDEEKLPQSHTAKFRLWRKASLRGFLPWEPNADQHWGGGYNYNTIFVKYYKPAFVHFVVEGDTKKDILPSHLFPGATGEDDYRDFIVANSAGTRGTNPKTHKYRPKTEMTLSADYIWPYSTVTHLGVQGVPVAGTTFAGYGKPFLDGVWDDTWRRYREPLIHLGLQRIEKKYGRMRGHLIGEFRASPQYWVEKYYCNKTACGTDQLLMELTATGGSGVGEKCRVAACTGTLESSETHRYNCDEGTCTQTTVKSISRNMDGKACTRKCSGALTAVGTGAWLKRKLGGTVTTTYQCPTCNRSFTKQESGGNVKSQVGVICKQPCPGHFRDAGVVRAQEITATAKDMLGFPAAGEGMGGLWLYCTYGRGASTWAHEIGHHKHLEHGPKGPGYVVGQHDSQPNATFVADPSTEARAWDRVCMMGYVRTGLHAADVDRGYFCGRCILKLRGWRVQGLTLPPGGTAGP